MKFLNFMCAQHWVRPFHSYCNCFLSSQTGPFSNSQSSGKRKRKRSSLTIAAGEEENDRIGLNLNSPAKPENPLLNPNIESKTKEAPHSTEVLSFKELEIEKEATSNTDPLSKTEIASPNKDLKQQLQKSLLYAIGEPEKYIASNHRNDCVCYQQCNPSSLNKPAKFKASISGEIVFKFGQNQCVFMEKCDKTNSNQSIPVETSSIEGSLQISEDDKLWFVCTMKNSSKDVCVFLINHLEIRNVRYSNPKNFKASKANDIVQNVNTDQSGFNNSNQNIIKPFFGLQFPNVYLELTPGSESDFAVNVSKFVKVLKKKVLNRPLSQEKSNCLNFDTVCSCKRLYRDMVMNYFSKSAMQLPHEILQAFESRLCISQKIQLMMGSEMINYVLQSFECCCKTVNNNIQTQNKGDNLNIMCDLESKLIDELHRA